MFSVEPLFFGALAIRTFNRGMNTRAQQLPNLFSHINTDIFLVLIPQAANLWGLDQLRNAEVCPVLRVWIFADGIHNRIRCAIVIGEFQEVLHTPTVDSVSSIRLTT